MTVKLLTEQHLVFLSLKEGCTGSSESTLVKMPHYWKSHVAAQIYVNVFFVMNESSRMTPRPCDTECSFTCNVTRNDLLSRV